VGDMPLLPLVPRHPVVLVSSLPEDHDSLRNIYHDSEWELKGAWSRSDGLEVIRRHRSERPVVICEDGLPDGGWKPLLKYLDKMENRPSLVICSRLADERLWAEVLNFGAFDLLLGAPFETEEACRVTQSAWLACNRPPNLRAVPRIGPQPAHNPDDDVEWAVAAG